jgi:cell division protein FtsZ
LVNLDFQDVRTVMQEPGKALMGTAQATGPDRAAKAAEQAMACPLLEGINLTGARGVLVLIAASRSTFKLAESRAAMSAIKRLAHEDAHVIYGTAYDETLGDALRVTVIATGLAGQAQRQAPVLVETRRTGTDNLPVLTQAIAPGAGAAASASGLAPHPLMGGAAGVGSGADFDGRSTPSVWRFGRAAQKVDALSASGVDDIEIPAFLRRQAD